MMDLVWIVDMDTKDLTLKAGALELGTVKAIGYGNYEGTDDHGRTCTCNDIAQAKAFVELDHKQASEL